MASEFADHALRRQSGDAPKSFDWRKYFRRSIGSTAIAARPVLRKCNSCLENVLEAASFPLVPYVNRIRGGHFTFRGRDVRLAPNMAGDISPLHGQGWLAPWQVDSAAPPEALLPSTTQPANGRGTYRAEQHFALDQRGLSLRLTCRNLSREPMPCGLGQHPYFPCGRETRIETRVTHVWTIDEHVLPVEKVPATGRFDLADRRCAGRTSTTASAAGAARRG